MASEPMAAGPFGAQVHNPNPVKKYCWLSSESKNKRQTNSWSQAIVILREQVQSMITYHNVLNSTVTSVLHPLVQAAGAVWPDLLDKIPHWRENAFWSPLSKENMYTLVAVLNEILDPDTIERMANEGLDLTTQAHRDLADIRLWQEFWWSPNRHPAPARNLTLYPGTTEFELLRHRDTRYNLLFVRVTNNLEQMRNINTRLSIFPSHSYTGWNLPASIDEITGSLAQAREWIAPPQPAPEPFLLQHLFGTRQLEGLCDICGETLFLQSVCRQTGGEHFVKPLCHHNYCILCLARWIKTKVGDGEQVIKCPEPTCTVVMYPDDVMRLGDYEDVKRFNQLLSREYSARLQSVSW